MSGDTIESSMISFHDINHDDLSISIKLYGVEATWEYGDIIGQALLSLWMNQEIKLPHVIASQGELGSGKTSLAQGIARGLGVAHTTYVNSPTFAILQTHQGHIPFHHIDLYRLYDEEELTFLGLDDIIQDGIAYIEWPQRAPLFFQQPHLQFNLKYPQDEIQYRIFQCRIHALEADQKYKILHTLYQKLITHTST